MKRTKWIAALCLVLAVITAGSTFARYATTLSDSFTLDILAQLYELKFDAQGGIFSDAVTEKTVAQHGKSQFSVISDVPSSTYGSFAGWDNIATPEVEFYKSGDSLDVPLAGYTLRAVWTPINNLQGDQFETIDPGENDIAFQVKGETGKFERIFINLGELDPDYTYKIAFDYSVDGKYQNSPTGGYGWKVIDSATYSKASNLSTTTNPADGRDSLNITLNPLVDGAFADGQNVKYDNIHREGLFVPANGNNYLLLDVSDFQDGGVASNHYLSNLSVTRINGNIKHNFTDNDASISPKTPNESGNYYFTLNTKTGTHERIAIPLAYTFDIGQTYKIEFVYGDSARYIGNYRYNYTVDSDISCLSTKIQSPETDSWTGALEVRTNAGSSSYTYEFKATGTKMYLLFHLANLTDDASHNLEISSIVITKVAE